MNKYIFEDSFKEAKFTLIYHGIVEIVNFKNQCRIQAMASRVCRNVVG